MKQRHTILNNIQDNPTTTVLIVGGGVNGISAFRELAAQGIDVLLVEKSDFCSGSSAASSHMLHGGLRYLENGEFRLVREALHERNLMLQNAPHYAHPLPTTIPIFSWFSGMLNAPLKFLDLLNSPSERGALVIKLGLTFYDWFVRNDTPMPQHKFASRGAALRKRPHLNPNVVATATYYDAWMPSPERICMELIDDAEAMHTNAFALNYMALDSADGNTVTIRDMMTDETYSITPQVVINAAGPWIDFANTALQNTQQYIGGTKGSHLVVDNPALHEATQGHEMFFENNDGRITLFFPLEDRVLMGTTDIPIENPDDAVCTPEEEAYILELVNKVFPSINVNSDQIVYRFSGVRPLPHMDANSPGQISRDHSIKIDEPNNAIKFPVYSMVSGKWTTYRAFGEQTVDKVLQRLGIARKVSTQNMRIGGGKDYPIDQDEQQIWITDLAEETRLPTERIAELFKRYGTRAAYVAAFIAGAPGDTPLTHAPSYSTREVIFIAQDEKVMRLLDFAQRRSLLAMLGKLTPELINELAEVLGQALKWSPEQQHAEIDHTQTMLREKHGMDL